MSGEYKSTLSAPIDYTLPVIDNRRALKHKLVDKQKADRKSSSRVAESLVSPSARTGVKVDPMNRCDLHYFAGNTSNAAVLKESVAGR